jgi:hypothetical protein
MENETDSNRFISMILNVDIDDEGNLYIMDDMKRRIHKYDKNCNFVKTFGRMGNGPESSNIRERSMSEKTRFLYLI